MQGWQEHEAFNTFAVFQRECRCISTSDNSTQYIVYCSLESIGCYKNGVCYEKLDEGIAGNDTGYAQGNQTNGL